MAKQLTATTTGTPNLRRVLDVALQVGQPGSQQVQVLLGVGRVERLAGDHLRAAAVHLERAHGGHHHHHVRDQPGVAALDVEELLHADVGAEAATR